MTHVRDHFSGRLTFLNLIFLDSQSVYILTTTYYLISMCVSSLGLQSMMDGQDMDRDRFSHRDLAEGSCSNGPMFIKYWKLVIKMSIAIQKAIYHENSVL
jgi:hypothetical protein